MRVQLRQGDCVVRLQELEDGCLGAVVSDPPYGLEFMGKEWDAPWKYGIRKVGWKSFGALPSFTSSRNPICKTCRKHMRGGKGHPACICELPDYDQTDHMIRDRQAYQNWCSTWLVELFRTLQPGGRVVLFGGSRMFHRMAVAMEEVGFTNLQLSAWCYFSGFPKSHNVARALDDHQGVERPMIRIPASQIRNPKSINSGHGIEGGDRPWMQEALIRGYHEKVSPDPVSPEAVRYLGYGTALKPAWEPVVMAVRPWSR